MGKIVVIGSSNTDMVATASSMPLPGQTVHGNSFTVIQGGKGANQAVAAARAGAHVTFIAKVGDDDFGKQAIAAYETEGIDTCQIEIQKGCSTGVAVITVDESSGENSIVVIGGANATFQAEELDEIEADIEEADILLVQLEIPLAVVEKALRMAHKYKVQTVLNPAPAIELSDELLGLVDILIPNETEAALLSGITAESEESLNLVLDKLLQHVNEAVILTLGSQGVVYRSKGGAPIHIKANQVKAIDTTAAGDVFCGYLVSFLSENNAIDEAIKLANNAAAISVTRKGAQPSIPFIKELK
ncbi:ribokinase [Carboxylicivirga marina]|uniref:Ribokinase n=1 Tax=Carboxylicivirga marina TaxID=2800988 RepID=A0ABS1HM77_9BACT|nr:ribokinase [Carboxylicivirga marina]MBK3518793.1 ribokinase [Carboxylicivirga marina]